MDKNYTINDQLTQGLAAVEDKAVRKKIVYNALTEMFFPTGEMTDREFSIYKYSEQGIIIPEEALRGNDPTRVNYGKPFKETAISGRYFNVEDTVDFKKAKNRVFGETVAQPWDLRQRQLYLLAEKREAILGGIKLNKEVMVRDLIFNGKYDTISAGEQIFPVDNTFLNISGTNLTTKPRDVLSTAVGKIIDAGGMVDKIIVNPATAMKLANSTAFEKLLDNRRDFGSELNFGAIDELGRAHVGFITSLGCGPLEIIAYYGKDGENAYLIPNDEAILAGSPFGQMNYNGVYTLGPDNITDLKASDVEVLVGTSVNMFLSTVAVNVQSCPCPIITGLDSYGIIKSIT